jgi:hypothetical protein
VILSNQIQSQINLFEDELFLFFNEKKMIRLKKEMNLGRRSFVKKTVWYECLFDKNEWIV